MDKDGVGEIQILADPLNRFQPAIKTLNTLIWVQTPTGGENKNTNDLEQNLCDWYAPSHPGLQKHLLWAQYAAATWMGRRLRRGLCWEQALWAIKIVILIIIILGCAGM